MNESKPVHSREQIEAELERLRARAQELERQLDATLGKPWWPAFYTSYHVVVGAMLGLAAAGTSLLFNLIGSLMVGLHPLQLIRVYLTFPLGERALSAQDDSFALSAGCFLYLSTGMVFGALLHVLLMKYCFHRGLMARMLVSGVLGLCLWVFNFYLVLSWLQPLLFGGSWILQQIPPMVAAATHLVFAWTIALMGRFGTFRPAPVLSSAAPSNLP